MGLSKRLGRGGGGMREETACSMKVEPTEEVPGASTLPMFLQGRGWGC